MMVVLVVVQVSLALTIEAIPLCCGDGGDTTVAMVQVSLAILAPLQLSHSGLPGLHSSLAE